MGVKEVDNAVVDSSSNKQPPISKAKTTRKPTKRYKKAPGAPKRFRSAFILFSQQKHKEIHDQLVNKKDVAGDGVVASSEKCTTTSVAKLVSEAWKTMNSEDRAIWNAKATRDRERYEKEKLAYKGPWAVPIGHRKSKDPAAPKRPPSAFLSFSNSRRAAVKGDNKDASNAEISRILSQMWKDAPDDVRKEYQETEHKARTEYKIKIAEWREEDKKSKKAVKKDPLEIYDESGGIGAYGVPDPPTRSKAGRKKKTTATKVTTKKATKATTKGRKRTADSSVAKGGKEASKRKKAPVTVSSEGVGRAGMASVDDTSLPMHMGQGQHYSTQSMGFDSHVGLGNSNMNAPIQQIPQHLGMNPNFPSANGFGGGLSPEQQLLLLRGGGPPASAPMNMHGMMPNSSSSFQGYPGSDMRQHPDISQQLLLRNQLSQLSNLELMQLSQPHLFNNNNGGGYNGPTAGYGANGGNYVSAQPNGQSMTPNAFGNLRFRNA